MHGDLRNDVARGILKFRNADTPIAADPDPTPPETEDEEIAAAGEGEATMMTLNPQLPEAPTTDGEAVSDVEVDDEDGDNDSEDSDADYVPIFSLSGRKPSATHGMALRHRANAATISREEHKLLHIGLAKRPDEHADLPVEVVLRAAAMTMAASRLLTTAPTNLKQALMAPDRGLRIDAIFKGISGLKEKEVWEEVLRTDVPVGKSWYHRGTERASAGGSHGET